MGTSPFSCADTTIFSMHVEKRWQITGLVSVEGLLRMMNSVKQ
jgi:hypothetical protein